MSGEGVGLWVRVREGEGEGKGKGEGWGWGWVSFGVEGGSECMGVHCASECVSTSQSSVARTQHHHSEAITCRRAAIIRSSGWGGGRVGEVLLCRTVCPRYLTTRSPCYIMWIRSNKSSERSTKSL